jgi:hypothetical protein
LVNVNAVAHDEAFGSASMPCVPPQPIGAWPAILIEPETVAFGYLRERLY